MTSVGSCGTYMALALHSADVVGHRSCHTKKSGKVVLYQMEFVKEPQHVLRGWGPQDLTQPDTTAHSGFLCVGTWVFLKVSLARGIYQGMPEAA